MHESERLPTEAIMVVIRDYATAPSGARKVKWMRKGMALLLFLIGAIIVLIVFYAMLGYITAMAPFIVIGLLLGVVLFLVVLGMIYGMSSSREYFKGK